MEDVKLEFPSLPECKEDAEVSLSGDCHAQASPCGSSAAGRPQAPTVEVSGSPGALLLPETVLGPRGGASRPGAVCFDPHSMRTFSSPETLAEGQLGLVYLIKWEGQKQSFLPETRRPGLTLREVPLFIAKAIRG